MNDALSRREKGRVVRPAVHDITVSLCTENIYWEMSKKLRLTELCAQWYLSNTCIWTRFQGTRISKSQDCLANSVSQKLRMTY